MSRSNRQDRNPKGKRARQHDLPSDFIPQPRTRKTSKPLQPQTDAQHSYINAINVYDLVFALGPAGTGKTYIAARMAAEALMRGDIKKIIITRPAVQSEEEHGFLPGDLDEKFEPYLAPVRSIMEEAMGAGAFEYDYAAGKIQIAPLAFLRGHTFKDCWVLFDEAQNATPNQMRLFLTRIGENCKVIVDGDLDQMDINGLSGLEDSLDRLHDMKQVGVVKFTTDDIVRSGLAKEILIRYSKKGTHLGPTIGFGFLNQSARSAD